MTKKDISHFVEHTATDYTGPERIYHKKNIEKLLDKYNNNSQQQRDDTPHIDNYLPSKDFHHEEWDCHPYRRRPYGMWTPLIRGAQESLKEFGFRYADDQIYTLLRWGLTAGLIAVVAGASLSINYLIKETQPFAIEINTPKNSLEYRE